jgi:hypothetical protein
MLTISLPTGSGRFVAMAFLIAGKLSHLPTNPLKKASSIT